MGDFTSEEQRAIDEIMGGDPAESSVGSIIDLYDHEVAECERILALLNQKAGKRADLESFRQEIIERFGLAKCGSRGECGLNVEVKVYEGLDGEWYSFKIIIVGRTDPRHTFDHDQQVYEATNDILELGTKGVIKTNGLIVE